MKTKVKPKSVVNHTPTQWKLDKDGQTMFIDEPRAGWHGRQIIGTAFNDNAIFIVHAVNAHHSWYRLEELTRPGADMADQAVNTFIKNVIIKAEGK